MSRHLPALAYRSGPRPTCGPHLLFCVSQRYFSPSIALQNGRNGVKDRGDEVSKSSPLLLFPSSRSRRNHFIRENPVIKPSDTLSGPRRKLPFPFNKRPKLYGKGSKLNGNELKTYGKRPKLDGNEPKT